MTTIVGAIGMIAAGIVFTFFSRPLLEKHSSRFGACPDEYPLSFTIARLFCYWWRTLYFGRGTSAFWNSLNSDEHLPPPRPTKETDR